MAQGQYEQAQALLSESLLLSVGGGLLGLLLAAGVLRTLAHSESK